MGRTQHFLTLNMAVHKVTAVLYRVNGFRKERERERPAARRTEMWTRADLSHGAVTEFQAHSMELIRITGRHLASAALISVYTHWSFYFCCLSAYNCAPLSHFACRIFILVTCDVTTIYLCPIKCTHPWPLALSNTRLCFTTKYAC